jgi:hypothetical protein
MVLLHRWVLLPMFLVISTAARPILRSLDSLPHRSRRFFFPRLESILFFTTHTAFPFALKVGLRANTINSQR